MNCLDKKLSDICIICQWTNFFTTIIYQEVIADKNLIEKFLDFDMEVIIPLIRQSSLKWYSKFKNNLLDNREDILKFNNNPITSLIKKILEIKENSSDEEIINHINLNSGLVALEFVKSRFFKELINSLK